MGPNDQEHRVTTRQTGLCIEDPWRHRLLYRAEKPFKHVMSDNEGLLPGHWTA